MQDNVLGTFRIIRGFADLRDLVSVSKAIPYQALGLGQGTGYQRSVNIQHVDDIKRFLSRGRYRFFPEIVLSLRSKGANDPIASYSKRRTSPTDQAYRVSVDLKGLEADGFARIHRIDGNHRLEAAKAMLDEQTRSATFKDFNKVPFCFVVLDSDNREDDDLAEAMLFNLINSKALSITSEHSLSVLMRDEGAPAERFVEDPQVYLTRWMMQKVKEWPHGFYDAMGDTPLSRLHSAAAVLLRPDGLAKSTAKEMEKDASKLFDPLYELAVQLRDQHQGFVHSYSFLPIAAEVYTRHSNVGPAKGANTEQERIRRAARWLRAFAQWFERVGGAELPLSTDPSVLWFVFKRDHDRRAGQVFIAMSFRESKVLNGVQQAFEEAIQSFNESHPDSPLSPIRIDKQKGASYEIPTRVFQEIDNSRLVIADLTDEKPNVYCEVGYAKAKGIPFFLTFQKTTADPGKGGTGATSNRVHFDLAPYRYIEYETTHELRDKLKQELDSWHDQS
jgi:hypothetical protein